MSVTSVDLQTSRTSNMKLFLELELLQKYMYVFIGIVTVLLFVSVLLVLCYYLRKIKKRKKWILRKIGEEPPSYDEAMKARELEPPTYDQAQLMFESDY